MNALTGIWSLTWRIAEKVGHAFRHETSHFSGRPCLCEISRAPAELQISDFLLYEWESLPASTIRSEISAIFCHFSSMKELAASMMCVETEVAHAFRLSEPIAHCLSEEERQELETQLEEYLANPHLIARWEGQYAFSALIYLLRLIPAQTVRDRDIEPALCFDIVRLLLRINDMSSESKVHKCRSLPSGVQHYRRMLALLLPKLDPKYYPQIQQLIQKDCPGSLGALLYASSKGQQQSLVAPVLEHFSIERMDDAVLSLSLLASYPSCIERMRHAFTCLTRAGVVSTNLAIFLVLTVHDSEEELSTELWQYYLENAKEKKIQDLLEQGPSCSIQEWQWKMLFSKYAIEELCEYLPEWQKNMNNFEDSVALVKGYLTGCSDENTRVQFLRKWMHDPLTGIVLLHPSCVVVMAFIELTYRNSSSPQKEWLSIWRQVVQNCTEDEALQLLLALRSIFVHPKIDKEYILVSFHRFILEALPKEKVQEVVDESNESTIISPELMASVLLLKPGLVKQQFPQKLGETARCGNPLMFISIWRVLKAVSVSDKQVLNSICKGIVEGARGVIPIGLFTIALDMHLPVEVIAALLQNCPSETVVAVVRRELVLLRLNQEMLGSQVAAVPQVLTPIHSRHYTLFTAMSYAQLSDWISIDGHEATILFPGVLERVIADSVDLTNMHYRKLVLLLEQSDVDYPSQNLCEALRILSTSEFKAEVPRLAQLYTNEDGARYDSSTACLVLDLWSDPELREKVFTGDDAAKVSSDNLLTVLPYLTPWLSVDHVCYVAQSVGIEKMDRCIALLSGEQRQGLHGLYEQTVQECLTDSSATQKARLKRLAHIGKLLHIESVALNTYLQNQIGSLPLASGLSVMVEAVPKASRCTQVANAALLVGARGAIHIDVLREVTGLTNGDLDALDMEWMTVHALLFTPFANQLSLFSESNYEEELRMALQDSLIERGIHTRDSLLDYLRKDKT